MEGMLFSSLINRGNKISDAIANLNSEARKTGKLAMISLPTTTELPTITIAEVSSKYALRFLFITTYLIR